MFLGQLQILEQEPRRIVFFLLLFFFHLVRRCTSHCLEEPCLSVVGQAFQPKYDI